ncbi:MAG: helix-turn-helix domain-containing protein [Blastocatellia bacterium]
MDLVTVAEAAKLLGISRGAVYLAVREKRIAAVTLLGKIGIPRAELEKYEPVAVRVRAGKQRGPSDGKPKKGRSLGR